MKSQRAPLLEAVIVIVILVGLVEGNFWLDKIEHSRNWRGSTAALPLTGLYAWIIFLLVAVFQGWLASMCYKSNRLGIGLLCAILTAVAILAGRSQLGGLLFNIALVGGIIFLLVSIIYRGRKDNVGETNT